jgi:hypothetical protein|tara:strand:+ start:572 stop:1036 length:465 start_codon:yes stop_codon:yes gene_type:complete
MAYNKFRWFSKGTYRRKPLKSKEPLLLRIQNGDFDYSPYLLESVDEQENYQKKYDNFMDTSLISDIGDKKVEAHQHAKLRRIASQKLMEKGLVEEFIRLKELRTQLTDEFENDLWDKCLEKQRGSGTTEDMYWWYKKQCKLSYTKSELQIKGIL